MEQLSLRKEKWWVHLILDALLCRSIRKGDDILELFFVQPLCLCISKVRHRILTPHVTEFLRKFIMWHMKNDIYLTTPHFKFHIQQVCDIKTSFVSLVFITKMSKHYNNNNWKPVTHNYHQHMSLYLLYHRLIIVWCNLRKNLSSKFFFEFLYDYLFVIQDLLMIVHRNQSRVRFVFIL